MEFVPFLKKVATDLVDKKGDSRDYSKMTIAFPNKRARLFLNKYLLDVYNERYGGNAPLWAPDYATSSNLLEQFAHYYGINHTVVPDVDKFQLIQLLYRAYQNVAQRRITALTAEDEVPRRVLSKSLDEFYFLGEVILNDFDDIDKNLVDAKQLFRNFKDIKDLEDYSFLTPEQIDAVKEYLAHDFSETSLYKGFITLWEILGEVYDKFKEDLDHRGLAYAGMLHRMVAEKLMDHSVGLPEGLADDRQFVFVGFNALNGCESALLKKLQARKLADGSPSALFYWDYDSSYFDPTKMDGAEMKKRAGYRDDAGTFLRANLNGFKGASPAASRFMLLSNDLKSSPNELDENWGGHDYLQRLAKDPCTRVFAASTDTAQTKYVSKWISDLKNKGVDDSEMAIVLCDEKLLPAVLHSIPDSVTDLNVTMGFPLAQTPAYSFVHLLTQLQMGRGNGTRFNYNDVVAFLRHSIVRKWKPMLVEPLLRLLKENTKSYVSQNELLDSVDLLVPKKDIKVGEKTISVADMKAANETFIRLVFDSSVNIKPDAPAGNLIDWLLNVLRTATMVYRYQAKAGAPDFDTDDAHNFMGLYEEAYYQVFRMVNCLADAQQQCEEEGEQLSVVLFCKMLNKMFASAKVNYSGEPARGLQVMGFLETRSLDFKYLLMLSVGEKHMPKDSFAPSFIPYALRVGFHLPAIEHEDALYAYNFFRLLQRPASITLTYNASTQNSSGEQSRFLRQLKQEYKAFDQIIPLAFSEAPTLDNVQISIQKTDEDIQYIKNRYQFLPDEERKRLNEEVRNNQKGVTKIVLSPSALNSYLDCSLRFYFHYIKHLSADDEFDMDIDEAFFGRIFHKAMELIYCEIAGHNDGETNDWNCLVSATNLQPYLKKETVETIVDKAFAAEFHIKDKSDYTGIQLIKRGVLVELVLKQVNEDIKYAGEQGFVIYKPEYTVAQPVEVELRDNTKFTFRLGGVLDRRDVKDNTFRVVDYKTGGDSDGHKRKVASVDMMFGGGSKRGDKVFQTTLYSCLWNMKPGNGANNYNKANHMVQPVLMFPRQMNKDFSPELMLGATKKVAKPIAVNPSITDYANVEEEFMEHLKSVLREMLDKDIPFEATRDIDSCTFCDFKAICHREDATKNNF